MSGCQVSLNLRQRKIRLWCNRDQLQVEHIQSSTSVSLIATVGKILARLLRANFHFGEVPGRSRAVRLNLPLSQRSTPLQTATSTAKMEPQDHSLHASSFPTDPAEFDADDRISYSKLDNKFLLVQEDGTEFEFDDAIKRWIPVVDEALLEEQQKAYAVQGVDENEPVEAQRKKRKKEYVNGEDVCNCFHSLPNLTFSFNTAINPMDSC